MSLRPLRVLQLNIARSNVRMHALLNSLTSFDIVLFQEPWYGRVGTQRSDSVATGIDVQGTAANRGHGYLLWYRFRMSVWEEEKSRK